ncbi:MAG: hypothetical protein M3114_04115 [Thermoproteota archaeon]|nr:hypothetical protein [Thermoproteota archaeon]
MAKVNYIIKWVNYSEEQSDENLSEAGINYIEPNGEEIIITLWKLESAGYYYRPPRLLLWKKTILLHLRFSLLSYSSSPFIVTCTTIFQIYS